MTMLEGKLNGEPIGLENFVDKQSERIHKHLQFLRDEKVITSKDVALQWIIDIGVDYDGQRTVASLMNQIDEFMAYAIIALEKPE